MSVTSCDDSSVRDSRRDGSKQGETMKPTEKQINKARLALERYLPVGGHVLHCGVYPSCNCGGLGFDIPLEVCGPNLVNVVAGAIAGAVAAERARCARIARDMAEADMCAAEASAGQLRVMCEDQASRAESIALEIEGEA
jgi:hypothetical protein